MSNARVLERQKDRGEMSEVAIKAREAAELVARRSYGKLVAFLASRARDVTAAEDALSEAFAAALTDWPVKGVPSNPEAWLMTVARRKWIDAIVIAAAAVSWTRIWIRLQR
jgi:predicted RNA polymerase sigma factor